MRDAIIRTTARRFPVPRAVAACLAISALLLPALPLASEPLPPRLLWPADGLRLTEQTGDQLTGDVLADGRGGAFVAWVDGIGGDPDHDLYLQRIDASGRIAWRAHRTIGRPLCTAPGRQFLVRLAPDGAGGVFATWYDERGSSPDIYAIRVAGDGTLPPGWPPDGTAVCAAPATQTDPVIASDGAGGAYIAWEDFRSGFANGRIHAQRVLPAGAAAGGWPADGIQVANGTGIEFQPAIALDGAGGVFLAWVRYRGIGSETDLVATRVTSSGAIAGGWPDSGLVICAAPGRQDLPTIVPDAEGGFYAVWRDYRDETDFSDGGESDIYAQRVSGAGMFPAGWGGDGLAVRAAPGDERIPKAVADGSGGLLVAWENDATGVPNVFVQRITPEGLVAAGWDAAGVATGTVSASGQGPALTGDGAGGAIVAWTDYRPATNLDVYAQRITANGTRAEGWAPGGVPVATAPDQQQIGAGSAVVSSIVTDGQGGAIFAWMDFGAPDGADVLAQRITATGVVGPWSCPGCDGIVGVAPNPGSGRFRLDVRGSEGGGEAIVRVYDVGGRLRHERAYGVLPPGGVSTLEIDLSALPSGRYYVAYSAGGSAAPIGTGSLVIVR
jgi:hypothetical protein